VADELCITEIDAAAPQADAWFPANDPAVWHEKSREAHPADEKHLCSYAFVDYLRR
jgi:dihydrofolate reductase